MTDLGRRHPELTTLRRLTRRRSARWEHGVCVVEGPKLVAELLASGPTPVAVYAESPDWIEAHSVPTHLARLVPPGVLDAALSTSSPQPVAALVPIPMWSLDDLAPSETANGTVLVAVGVQDPGNLGTMIRSAAASGADAVILTADDVAGDGTDATHPRVIRGSAGAALRFPVVEVTRDALFDALAMLGCVAIAATSSGGEPLWTADLGERTAFLIGSEGVGLPDDVVAAADRRVHVPMRNSVESLNAATTASLLLFEVARRRDV